MSQAELHLTCFTDSGPSWQASPQGPGVGCVSGKSEPKPDDARRLRRLLGSGMFAPPAAELTLSRAVCASELVEAYQLVHDAFVEEGLLEPRPSRLRVRACEVTPDMATFIAKSAGRVVGVLSVIGDSRDLGLPSDPVFRGELGRLRSAGRRVAEITNLAIAREFRKTTVFLELARAVLAWGLEHGFDDGFAAVSPKHGPYFERILRFRAWGERRSYRLDADDPVQGFRLDLHGFESSLREIDGLLGDRARLHDWFFEDNPFRRTSLRTSEQALAAFFRDDVPRCLLGDPERFLEAVDEPVRAGLQRRWQGEARKS